MKSFTYKAMLGLIVMVVAAFVSTANGQDFNGSWTGALEAGPYSRTLKFNIHQTDDSVSVIWDLSDLVKPFRSDSTMQEMKHLEFPATIIGNELTIEYLGTLKLRGTLVGDTIHGSFSFMGMDLPMNLVRGNSGTDRPQEAAVEADNNKPYHSEEVTFNNGDIRLVGTLSLPNEGNHFPAVVFVHGTGELDRDENMFRHKPFLLLADALCRQGFAVLRYDKRSVGDSININMLLSTSTKDLAEDAMAGLRYLMSRPEVDASQVGILGHSEGGCIAIMNAANYPDELAFIVSMAGVGTTGLEMAKKQKRMIPSTLGIEPNEAGMQLNDRILEILSEPTDSATVCQKLREFIEENDSQLMSHIFAPDSSLVQQIYDSMNKEFNEPMNEELYESMKKAFHESMKNYEPMKNQLYESMIKFWISPSQRYLVQYDPTDYLKHIKCPMLAINGTLDSQVACEDNLNAIARLVPHATVKPYEGLNHMFQTCADWKSSSNYATIQETLAPQVITDIAEWLTSITRK